MITLSTTHQPATDLGYLLHKNPARSHEVTLTFGRAVVAYPEASEERCTAAVFVDVDAVGLVRNRDQGGLAQYVNDRPYVASSFLSVALRELFSTAMNGKCKERPELVDQALPLTVEIPVIAARGGGEFVRALFEPLGYTVEADPIPLDEKFPEWDQGVTPRYWKLRLAVNATVRDVLRQLYILIPVLDARKHYFLDEAEVQKLVSKGEGWLKTHPLMKTIVRSFLGRKPSLQREALAQLSSHEPELEVAEGEETPREKRLSLHAQRHQRVVELIRELKPRSVIDLGCGEGRLLRKLVPIQGIERIVGMDVSYYDLERAQKFLHMEEGVDRYRGRVSLFQGSLMYHDDRLAGFDVATVIEVIEHLDVPRLSAFCEVVFGCAQPKTVIVTTPNQEYNAVYEGMDGMRHEDHRFEWTRSEFEAWAAAQAEKYGYTVRFEGLGEAHEEFGAPSQMGVFSR